MENVHKMFIQQLNNATFTYRTVDKRIKEMKERGYNYEEKGRKVGQSVEENNNGNL